MSIADIPAARPIARPVLVIIAAALLSLAGARPGRAEAPMREARELYEAGLQSYRAGNYDDAIAKLSASYQLVPAPGLLYDLAQAHRLKRDCFQARALYRQFLDQAPGGPAETLARSRLAEMDKCVADGAPVPAAATATPSGPAPPLEASAQATAAPVLPASPARPVGARPEVDLRSGSASPTNGATSPPRRSRFAGRRAALAAGIAAVGLAAATGFFAWRADQMSTQVSGMFLPGQHWSTAGIDAQASGRSSDTLALVTAVGALLSGGIAVWLARRN